MTMQALVAEVHAAAATADLPRAERAAFDLRTRYGVSVVDPTVPQARFSPYRVDSSLRPRCDLAATSLQVTP